MATLAITGDVMLGRNVNEFITFHGPSYPWGDMLPVLRETDLRLINLECAITARDRPWSKTPKVFFFRTNPQNVRVLKAANINFVSIANNHIMDFREEGLIETTAVLDRAGIHYAGAGRNVEEARGPAFLAAGGQRFGIVAFTDNEPVWAAGEDRPGTNYIPVSLDEEHLSIVQKVLERAREGEGSDFVIATFHWGPNMVRYPSRDFIDFAHAVIDAGCDLFWGHSAHLFQPVEVYKDRLILYDTGDFVDDYYVSAERNDQSFLFVATVDKGKTVSLRLIPVLISQCQVNQARGQEAQEICKKMQAISRGYGTEFELRDDALELNL